MRNNLDDSYQVYDFSNYKLRKIIECKHHSNELKEDKTTDKNIKHLSKVGKCDEEICFVNQRLKNSLLPQHDFENNHQTQHEKNHFDDIQYGESYLFHIQNNFQIKDCDLEKQGLKRENDTCLQKNYNSPKTKNNSYNKNIGKTNTFVNTIKCMKNEQNNEPELYNNNPCGQGCNDCNFRNNKDIKKSQQTTCIDKIKEMVTTLKTSNGLDEQQRKRYVN
jgi:hypothetical protein